jgi:ribosomal protein S1
VDKSLTTNPCRLQQKSTEIKTGTVVLGRVSKILPAGVNMQLSPHAYGRAYITDIADDYTEKPLAGM